MCQREIFLQKVIISWKPQINVAQRSLRDMETLIRTTAHM